MAAKISVQDGVTPIVTFVSLIVLGIVISQFVLTDPRYKAIIILFSFFMGAVLAGLELRSIISRRKREASTSSASKLTPEDRKKKLAKYVADLFEEEISLDDDEEITDRVTE